MTNEEMDRAIAEFCGWTDLHKGPHDRTYSGRFKDHRLHPIPAYSTDLNAMHEAEKTLSDEDFERHYGRFLGAASQAMTRRAIVSATAHQRAQAFLRTIGKYSDATHPLS